MKPSTRALARTFAAAVGLALAATSPSLAQGSGGVPPNGTPPTPSGPGPGGGMGSPFPTSYHGGSGSPSYNVPQHQPSDDRVGLQFGPPGRGWDDHGFAKSLKLRPDQQQRMDAIFERNRGALTSSFQNAQQAQTQMEELAKSSSPDETSLFAQIDRVAQAHAELEKATTHYLLQLRKEMDADQIKRLEKSTPR
jgi:Spy/CpxP family protein refolding chaperone